MLSSLFLCRSHGTQHASSGLSLGNGPGVTMVAASHLEMQEAHSYACVQYWV